MNQIIKLLRDLLYQYNGIERFIIRCEKLDLERVFNSSNENPFKDEGYHLVLIVDSIYKITNTNINQIQYTSNVNDLIQFRNSNFKFICICNSNTEINDSINGSSLIINNIEKKLLKKHLIKILNDSELSIRIVENLLSFELSQDIYWEILMTNNSDDFSMKSNCFTINNLSLNERHEKSKNILSIIKTWFSNDGPNKYIIETKLSDEETISNYKMIYDKINELTTFSKEIEVQIYEICCQNKEIFDLISNTKWEIKNLNPIKELVNKNPGFRKLSYPYEIEYLPFQNLSFECQDIENVDFILLNDFQISKNKTIDIDRSVLVADENKIRLQNDNSTYDITFISKLDKIPYLIYAQNGKKTIKISKIKNSESFKTDAIDESNRITFGIILEKSIEIENIKLVNNEDQEDYIAFSQITTEEFVNHYYFEDQINPDISEILIKTSHFRIKIELNYKNSSYKEIDYSNILEKKFLQKLGKIGFYKYKNQNNSLEKLFFDFLKTSGHSLIVNLSTLNADETEIMVSNRLHYIGNVDQSVYDQDFRIIPTENILKEYQEKKEKITQYLLNIGLEKINIIDFLASKEFIEIATSYIEEYFKLIDQDFEVNYLETIFLADNPSVGCTENDIIGIILPITHPLILKELISYRKLLGTEDASTVNPIISTTNRILLREYAFKNKIALYFNCLDIESTLFSIYYKSPLDLNNRDFQLKLLEILAKNDIKILKTTSELGKAEIFKSINEIRNYIPIRNELTILFKISDTNLQLEQIILEYIEYQLSDYDEMMVFNIYDTRHIEAIDENIISYINNLQTHRVNWYSIKDQSILKDQTILNHIDLLVDINFPQENYNISAPLESEDNYIDTLKLSRIFTKSTQQTNTINKNVFISESNQYRRRFLSPFLNQRIINKQIIREHLYNLYDRAKMIATTSDSYNYFSNLNTTIHNAYLYEYHLTKYDNNENSNGNFYLIINESKHYEQKIAQLFQKLYTPINEEAIKYFIQISNLRGVFQIKNTLSNRNKTQGIIGENLIYLTLFESFSNYKPCIIIPFDIFNDRIYSLTRNLTSKGSNNHPDFIFVNFENDGLVKINFIEVKNYSTTLTASEINAIYKNQIEPTINAFKELASITEGALEKITLKLLIVDFLEYYLSTVRNTDFHHEFFKNIQKFINADENNINIGSGLLFVSGQENRIFHTDTILRNNFSVFEFDVEELIARYHNSYLKNNKIKTFQDILKSEELVSIEGALFEDKTQNQVIHILESKSEKPDLYLKLASDQNRKNSYNNSESNQFTLKIDKDIDTKITPNSILHYVENDDKEENKVNLEVSDQNEKPAESIVYQKSISDNSILLEKYNLQISKIVYCLKEFGITVNGYPDLTNIGPASVTFKLKPASGVPTSKIEGKIDDLKLILELEQNQEINLFSDKGYLNLIVPKKSEDREFFSWEELNTSSLISSNNLILPFGFDNNRNITSVNFSSDNSPHLLIGGQTGSGKSVALKTLLKSAVNIYDHQRLQLVLVDPKGTELIDFENYPHLNNPISENKIGLDSEDAIQFIKSCIEEMNDRYERMKKVRVNNILKYNEIVPANEKLPWILLILDEYGELTADKNVRSNLESLLQRLAQKARACGIHLIITTQKPSNEVLSTIIRSNLPSQIALKVRSATDSKIVLSDQTGAEKLYGKGDALFNNGSIISRVQVAQ
jgi:hypothetical protein